MVITFMFMSLEEEQVLNSAKDSRIYTTGKRRSFSLWQGFRDIRDPQFSFPSAPPLILLANDCYNKQLAPANDFFSKSFFLTNKPIHSEIQLNFENILIVILLLLPCNWYFIVISYVIPYRDKKPRSPLEMAIKWSQPTISIHQVNPNY